MKKEIFYWSLMIVACLFMTFQALAAKAECPLVVDKKCFVEPAPQPPFVCSDAKPINSMTVIWNGPQEPVYVKAWNGPVGTGSPQTFGPIYLGDEVTFKRAGTFPNDIYWEIYSDAGFVYKIGESTFHLSCSDADMDGPEDCGKEAGDGKAVASYQNWWIFEGMGGNGLVLECTPAPVVGADACSQSGVADVTYNYTITNTGDTNVEVTSVFDDHLGELLSAPVTLAPGGSHTVDETALISETTTNKVTVSGQPDGSTSTCTATDSVTVTVGPLTLTIDIKPGSYPNSINPKSKGKIPVGILSTEEFDAPSQVDQDSLTFGRTGDEESLAFCNPWGEDINGDGLLDLVCHFYTQKAGFQCGDSEGFLKGMTTDDIPIEGTDSVRINPCK